MSLASSPDCCSTWRPPTNDCTFPTFVSACYKGQIASVKHLLQLNNYSKESLGFALNRTLEAGQASIANFLLHVGASADAQSSYCAAKSKNRSVLELLAGSAQSSDEVVISYSVILPMVVENEECVRLLLSHGADPNFGLPLGYPPFAHNGIDYDHQSSRALDATAECSTPTIFEMLLDRGAKLENALPLHAALGSTRRPAGERIPMMEYLVSKRHCDVNALDAKVPDHHQLGTPLHYAVRYGKFEEALWLLLAGAEPGKRNQKGLRASDFANVSGRKDTELLLEKLQQA